MSVDGKWYDFAGDCIGVNTSAVKSIEEEADFDEEKLSAPTQRVRQRWTTSEIAELKSYYKLLLSAKP